MRIGVDVGKVRVGLAASDPDGLLAVPVRTVHRPADRGGPGERAGAGPRAGAAAGASSRAAARADLAEIAEVIREYDAVEVVVGLPVTLSGHERQAASEVRRYADEIAQTIAPIPVQLADERMSTVLATRRLSERGLRGKRRRTVVDQAAAVEILQGWLDAHRRRPDA